MKCTQDLYVLEVNFRILAEINNGTKEVKEAFIAFERFEEFNQCLSSQLFMIFRSNLNCNLKILTDIGRKHCFQTFQWILYSQAAKIIDKPLNDKQNIISAYFYHNICERISYIDVKMLRVDYSSLDVINVRKVLKSPLHKPSFFTELSNCVAIVVGEHIVAENGISHFWIAHQIHF